MASLADLPGLAEQILAAFTAQLTEQGVNVPGRRYVPPGAQIVWDGEQLTVNLMGIEQGQPGQGDAHTFQPPTAVHYYAQFSVNLIREITAVNTEAFTDAEIPTAEQMDADGQSLIRDAAQLILAGTAIHVAGTLTGPGEGFVVGPLGPVGPQGGLAGTRLLLSLSLS